MTVTDRLADRGRLLTERLSQHAERIAYESDERTRLVRTLRDDHDMTWADMGRRFGITPQAVQQAYYRLLPEDKGGADD